MPLVSISLLKGKSSDYIRAISDSVHQSLVEAYNVPAGDRFQLIHQHDRDEFVYNADYLGVHRTDDLVFIHVTAGKWRDVATKKALFQRLAERLAESPGLRPEDVQVIISPNDREDWSFGKGLASYVTEP